MAFNFHWSPLTADSGFYSRAQELLTAALNKSPKPPIIVDDILVNELNLGSVPPELEILEIGDLAEDRFRGIFKMCYSGDAFLTLKTRVQANPLNTYLSTTPSFTSPKPLAAASSLTIPLKITLSDIKLSAFIILVFSKQKGLTLVFRNDPLESLKVSSTFDSIPFVRDYLQKEIEGQLRYLLMEELPVIIHRLSLRLWVPEHEMRETEGIVDPSKDSASDQKPIDPLAGLVQDAGMDASELSASPVGFGTSETQSLFSKKNLIRLAALTDSHRTLSLSTPSIGDAVFRAWAGASERGDGPGANTPATPSAPSLSRSHSYTGSTSSTYVFSESTETNYFSSRPPLTSFHSAMSGLGLGAGRHSRGHAGRKGKTRVVNLRRTKSSADGVTQDDTSSSQGTASEVNVPEKIVEEREDELVTPPRTPNAKFGAGSPRDNMDIRNSPAANLRPVTPPRSPEPSSDMVTQGTQTSPDRFSTSEISSVRLGSDRTSAVVTKPAVNSTLESNWGILERAWMAKMANEVAKRVKDEKGKHATTGKDFWQDDVEHEDVPPPPAYEH
ncbi:MAG: ERMES complex subunit [Peltula sp. TS41687]|nr:MAG: ERMES complex subunit [Peltula sp. TS41687]